MTVRDTSALLVVDMQNDFLATGGYYDEKDKRRRARQGKLSATDIDALARLYVHPPPTCEIRESYQDFVRTVTEVAATALRTGMTTVFVQAAYDPAFWYRPPLFLREPQRQDYGCHRGSWGQTSSNRSSSSLSRHMPRWSKSLPLTRFSQRGSTASSAAGR